MLQVEYLLHEPPQIDERTLLVLTLHGYGSNPDVMLRFSTLMLGKQAIIASLRAPNQHYLSSGPLGTPLPGSEIGYNWGTTRHAALNIELHHEMVRIALAELRERFDIPQKRIILMGFSQPVGLNYRFHWHPSERKREASSLSAAACLKTGKRISINRLTYLSCTSPAPKMNSFLRR